MDVKDIIFALILSCFCSSFSLAQPVLIQGQALNLSSKLVSENRNFTLEFGTIGTTDSNGSYLGIWFNSALGYKPCWIANRDQPIRDNSGFFAIDASGTMKLNYSGGDLVTFYSNQSSSVNLTAELENSGNLVLRDANSPNREILWQSFDSPTDSFLPGMKLGNVNGEKRFLTSWLSESIPARGAFTLEWNTSSKQLEVQRRGTLFWTSGPLSGGFENMGISADPIDYIFNNVSKPNEEYLEFSVAPNKYYTPANQVQLNISMWVLNSDGSIAKPQTSMIINNGENCNGSSTEYGCERWIGPSCRSNGDRFVPRTGYFAGNVPSVSDYNASLSISDCKDMCWGDCSCVGIAAQFTPNDANKTGCFFYFGDFTEDPTGNYNRHYVIVDDTQTAKHETGERNWIWILAAVLTASLILVLIGIFLYMRRKRQKEKLLNDLLTYDTINDAQEHEVDENKGQNLKVYSVATIMAATDSFSAANKLGQGGFGPVYKGKLPDGREIAVKRLSRSSGQGLVEFKNELILIAKLQHTNLVRLLGCCIHGEEKMLVYEYMPNKSLDSFIFDQSKRKLLDWNKRFEIIEGIAQGLLYLHKYSRLRIIHRDLKVSNILLDEHMNPKISDFGMARIFKTDESAENTNRIVGTYGYMSPEYAMEGLFSVKSDVFSFGVLVLEIISGRKNHRLFQTDRPTHLVGYAWQIWKEGAALDLVDPILRECCSEEQVLRCINVGLLCVEDNALDRPFMSEVVSMLTSETVQLPTPKQPAFTNERSVVEVEMSISQGERGSINGMSVSTTMGGR